MTTLEKIIARCYAASMSPAQFEKLSDCPTLKEAWVVLADNMYWVFKNNILDIQDWKELLKAGVDCTIRRNSAIRWASFNDHTEVVELLKQHGAQL